MSILTVLVIGIAIVGLVSPVIADRPCDYIKVRGTINDAAGVDGWIVKVDYWEGPDGWVTLINNATLNLTGIYGSGDPRAVSCDHKANCPDPNYLNNCEYRYYKRWIWDSNGNVIVGGEQWLPNCDDWDTSGFCSCVLVWDYTAQPYIPEFSTIAIPVVSILGLLLFFNYRKRRGNK